MRLLRSNRNATQIAFVEFDSADSAAEALQCSGALLGECLPFVSAAALLGGKSFMQRFEISPCTMHRVLAW